MNPLIDTAAEACARAQACAVHILNLQLQNTAPNREELREWRTHLSRALCAVTELERQAS